MWFSVFPFLIVIKPKSSMKAIWIGVDDKRWYAVESLYNFVHVAVSIKRHRSVKSAIGNRQSISVGRSVGCVSIFVLLAAVWNFHLKITSLPPNRLLPMNYLDVAHLKKKMSKMFSCQHSWLVYVHGIRLIRSSTVLCDVCVCVCVWRNKNFTKTALNNWYEKWKIGSFLPFASYKRIHLCKTTAAATTLIIVI